MTHTTHSATDLAALPSLARHEIKRYLRHPLLLIGAALTIAACAMGPDKTSSSTFHVIVPATCLGVFGLLVMVSLVRGSDQANEAAGAVVASERTRTLALAASTVVPFSCGLLFFAWAVWAYHDQPPLASTIPFGDVGDAWVYAVLFALGTISCVGGPILGLVIGRWLPFRGAGIVSAVLLVMATIVFQGIVEPLRYVRVFMPWTYFGGPYGVEGEPERWLIITGSPFWYCAYLVALCVIGVIIAMLHDREQSRQTLFRVLAGVAVLAVVLCVLAMTTGVQEVMVNPLPGKA
jgi:hypothetical protein